MRSSQNLNRYILAVAVLLTLHTGLAILNALAATSAREIPGETPEAAGYGLGMVVGYILGGVVGFAVFPTLIVIGVTLIFKNMRNRRSMLKTSF